MAEPSVPSDQFPSAEELRSMISYAKQLDLEDSLSGAGEIA